MKLYLVDGTPAGVITAELGGSTVKAVTASRTSLPDLLERDEAARTGVYVLVGPDPDLPGRQKVYVGEGDQVRTRLKAHDGDDSKEFFTRVVLFVSKDENLTKAHGRYLESRLISGIRAAGRAKLANDTAPESRGLPEPEAADMERVLDEIDLFLPVLGFDLLKPAVDGTPQRPDQAAPTFTMEGNGAKARAIERGGEFVVLAGSTAVKRESGRIPNGAKNTRRALLDNGTLVASSNPGLYEFAQDASFGSPSGASCAVLGRTDNGRATWLVEGESTTYGVWRLNLLK